MVVACAEGHGDRLALLEAVDHGVGLLLPLVEGGDIAVGFVEAVDVAGRFGRPGGEGFLLDSPAAIVVGAEGVDSEPLGHGVGHGGDGMVGVHAARVAGDFGEGWHPLVAHLLGHAEI